MSDQNSKYKPGQTWVIKIGSSLLTQNGEGLAVGLVSEWVAQIVRLHKAGIQVVIVSSGAVAAGMSRLGMARRPQSLPMLQAAAAVGQMGLVQLYESNFQEYGLQTAQVLLTHEDLRSRERYINARGTLRNLLELGVIPVVNENDTVVTDEIRFGDNDTLAALVVNLIGADTLLLMTDQQGLFDADPRISEAAKLVKTARARDRSLDAMAGEGSLLGRGGMVTKITAARVAARSGANTVIAYGRENKVITRLSAGEVTGTLLLADEAVLDSRKQWLAGLPARGRLVLDTGAVRVLRGEGRSLLAVGVKSVAGVFTRGEMVACIDSEGLEVARGLVNYSHTEAAQIAGHASAEIESILGYAGEKEIIHRDNLVVV
ncbi:MAG: glutamate 5-kinase [Pseudomonadales bacterium]|nr:glutamate 5-kinase [Pseudomonadales bacterium]